MTFEELLLKMKSGEEFTPQQCLSYAEVLVGEMCLLDTKLETLIMDRAKYQADNRANHKSDKACSNAWDMTDKGVEMIKIQGRLRRIKEVKSALKSRLRVKEMEAKNLF
jgi:hypothetical protein